MRWLAAAILVVLFTIGIVTPVIADADITVIAKPPILAPVVISSNATDITSGSAILHGNITDTEGEDANTIGFEWGVFSGNYTYSWNATGSFGMGEFEHRISGLPINTHIFWRAFAINSGGTGYSAAMNFTTLALPLAPTDFTITQIGYNTYKISWTKGIGADTTIVRASETGYPSSVADGYPVYSGNGTWVIVDGLNPDMTTYFYRAWSENEYGYSLDYAETVLGNPLGISQLIFAMGLVGFALWKKGWIRILLALCVITWGAFAMPYDVKIAASLVAVGTILFVISIINIMRGGEKWYSEIPLVYHR